MLLKEFGNAFTTLHVGCLHISLNSVGRRNLEVGVLGCEHVNEFRVRDDAFRAITFCYPLREVSSDEVHESTRYLCIQNRLNLPELRISV